MIGRWGAATAHPKISIILDLVASASETLQAPRRRSGSLRLAVSAHEPRASSLEPGAGTWLG